ncbi:MAG: ABC transporter substrate-binding protein [Acinetobacter amyesii]|uniref:ABC transporter substrate-binding protein n=1 Tax=Acinetobacter amyesii TaxID=2942470 RepID=UPI003CFCD67F
MTTQTILFTRCPIPSGVGIAYHLGSFNDNFNSSNHQYRYDLLQNICEQSVLQNHFIHEIDNLIRFGGNIPALYAKSNGADTKLIGLAFIEGAQGLLVRPDSDIQSIQDLKGKKILLQTRPNEDIDFVYVTARKTYQAALEQAGLTFDDVIIVEKSKSTKFVQEKVSSISAKAHKQANEIDNGKYGDLLNPLLTGEVDVIASGTIGAPLHNMQHLFGLRKIFDLKDFEPVNRYNNSTPLTLTVSTALLQNHKDAVIYFVSKLKQAIQFTSENYDEAIRFIAADQGVPEQIAHSAFTLPNISASLSLSLEPYKIKALEKQKEYLLSLGVIPEDFSITEWIDDSILQSL